MGRQSNSAARRGRTATSAKPCRPQKLGERVRAALEEELFDGRLVPGQRLNEREIAARFGVSRTPVREAILQLAAMGLVETPPRQEAVVKTVDPAQLSQMFEVLAGLEALASRLAARRLIGSEMAALERLHREAGAAATAGDIDTFVALNSELHAQIARGAHNAYLQRQAGALRGRLAPYRKWLLAKMHRMEASHRDHEVLIAAIRAGDEEAAARAMWAHVHDSNRFMEYIFQSADAGVPLLPS